MNIYIVCWFDRHSDPFIKSFVKLDDAHNQIAECMRWRDYNYIDSEDQLPEDTSEFDWVWTYPAIRFVRADIDDGPHGYILEKALIGYED